MGRDDDAYVTYAEKKQLTVVQAVSYTLWRRVTYDDDRSIAEGWTLHRTKEEEGDV